MTFDRDFLLPGTLISLELHSSVVIGSAAAAAPPQRLSYLLTRHCFTQRTVAQTEVVLPVETIFLFKLFLCSSLVQNAQMFLPITKLIQRFPEQT